MRKIFQTALFIFLGALFSGAALATPTLLYEFKLNRLTCVYEGGVCNTQYDALNGMGIGLEPAALAEGQAALRIFSEWEEGAREFLNDGFSSIALALHPSSVRAISLDINDYPPTYPYFHRFDLQVQLAVDRFLKGSIYVNDAESELVMGSAKSFSDDLAQSWLQPLLLDPENENEWTGFIRSDALNTQILPFTGEWKFVGVVPEPGTLVLVLAALAGAAGVWRRRACSLSRPR